MMSSTPIDQLDDESEEETTLANEILSEEDDDDDENEGAEDCEEGDDYDNGDGITIPKNVTPVNEVEEFFKVHLVDSNNKAKEKLAHSALFDLFCGQSGNSITASGKQDRLHGCPRIHLGTEEERILRGQCPGIFAWQEDT
jgi:hypothetical protein